MEDHDEVRAKMEAGAVCVYCAEAFTPWDFDWPRHPLHPETSQHAHPACLLRSVLGSVGHQRGLCSCHGGSMEDPPGLTRRQGALAAFFEYHMTKDPHLTQYAVYYDPADYPGLYVVREWHIRPTAKGGASTTADVWTASTLNEARQYIPRGCYRMARADGDDPVIVETWV